MGPSRRFRAGRRWSVALAMLSIVGAWACCWRPSASAQDPEKAEPGAARLREMEKMARTVAILGTTAGQTPSDPEREPIVRYDDRPRHIEDATVWLFIRKGRPLAAMKIELYDNGHGLYGITSLSKENFSAKTTNGWGWEATRPGFDARPIPDAPAPSDSERSRLSQMKALARRFSGTESDSEHGKLTLRLLPTPIYRYGGGDSGVLDGAIFSLATGTNPDILLLIEASTPAGQKAPSWHYGIARLGGADLFASLDDRQVWTEPYAPIPTKRETYMNRFVLRRRPGG